MIICRVVGSIVSTRKNEKLIGNKLMVVEPIYSASMQSSRFVTIDNIGAGVGDIVLVARGSAARLACNLIDAPVDAAIVGIVDELAGLE